MARLIYTAIASLDGFVADERGNFDWAAPGEDVHSYVNDLERPIGTYLYGRRLYEVMAFWATPEAVDGQPDYVRDYAELWRAADKVVFSTTLDRPHTDRTIVERTFDPDAVRRMKGAADRDLSVGGPTLAAAAIAAGLVDEFRLFLVPVLVGGGTAALPDGVRLDLELREERRFDGGVVHLRYDATG